MTLYNQCPLQKQDKKAACLVDIHSKKPGIFSLDKNTPHSLHFTVAGTYFLLEERGLIDKSINIVAENEGVEVFYIGFGAGQRNIEITIKNKAKVTAFFAVKSTKNEAQSLRILGELL